MAAVAMVLLAIVVRGQLDDGDDPSTPSTGRGALKLFCASELTVVCDGLNSTDLDVTIEPAALTAARLQNVAADDAAIDGWLAPGPWGEIVDASRPASEAKLFETETVLGRSPLVLAAVVAKLTCAEPLDLGCVGDAVNKGQFRLGTPSDDEALGVLADAALSVGHVDNADFATNDLDETDLSQWLATIDRSADTIRQNPGGKSFTELLTFGPVYADGFLTTEAEVGPSLRTATRRGEIQMRYVRPVATADVAFAARPGDRGERLRDIVVTDRVRAALAQAGWRVPGQPPIAGLNPTPRLPDDDGLPSGGVLHALMEITR